MRKKILLLSVLAGSLLFAPSFNGNAEESSNNIYLAQSTDKKASFPGGKAELKKWLDENIDYPEESRRYGSVIVEFVVKKNGKLEKFTVYKGVNKELDGLAVDILSGMPKWEPAIKNGQPVESKAQVSVKFVPKSERGKLNESEEG